MAKTFSRADKVIEDYTIETFHPEDKVLLEIRQRAEKEGLPDIHVGPMDTRLFIDQSGTSKPRTSPGWLGTGAGFTWK